MYFALTDEQRALADTIRDYLADRFDLAAVRTVFEDADGDGHPADLWKAIGEQGWLAVCVPEEYDGLGLGMLDAQVIARAFGAGVVPGPWLSTVLAGEAVRLAGSSDQRSRMLRPLAAGDLVATVALRRTGGRFDASGIGVSVGADGTLTGAASPVEYLEAAHAVVVAATEPGYGADPGGAGGMGQAGGVGLYLVDPQAAGVSVSRLDSYDGTTRVASLVLAGAPAERLPGSSSRTYTDIVDRGAVLAAADLAGLSREALARTVAYDRDREQFGRPVGSFQALKHHLADLYIAVTMAEHAVLYAAHALDINLDDAELAVAVAKSKASDTAREVTAAMIQYHGGIGYTWEHEAHFFYKRAKRECYTFGDAREHRERIAALTID